MRHIPVLPAALVCLVAACSAGQPAVFAVTAASVDPTYFCPAGSKDAPYDLHATVDVRNGESSTVTIQSMSADMKLVSVHGQWLEKVGDIYTTDNVVFSPASVGAGSTAKIAVTIPSACTSGGSSAGDYAVTMHLVTSAGSFSVTAKNQHEIRAG